MIRYRSSDPEQPTIVVLGRHTLSGMYRTDHVNTDAYLRDLRICLRSHEETQRVDRFVRTFPRIVHIARAIFIYPDGFLALT